MKAKPKSFFSPLSLAERRGCLVTLHRLCDWLPPLPVGLTGTVAELEAQVGTPEAVYGNGQLDHLVPAGAVVVVEHERAILAGVGLAAAQADAVLRARRIRRE